MKLTTTSPPTRPCPFPIRGTWAVYKAGTLWRVLAPARAHAAHQADAWVADFASHAEALTWVTDPTVREVWSNRPEARSLSGSDRILFIEGMWLHCSTLRHLLFDGQKVAA